MNKNNFEKLFSRGRNPHAPLITRPEVHLRPTLGYMTEWHTNSPAGG